MPPDALDHVLQGTAPLYLEALQGADGVRRGKRPQTARAAPPPFPGGDLRWRQRPCTAGALRTAPLLPATASGVAAATAPSSPNPRLREKLIRLALRAAAVADLEPHPPVASPSAHLMQPIGTEHRRSPDKATTHAAASPVCASVSVSPRLYPGASEARRRPRYVCNPSCRAVAALWQGRLRQDCGRDVDQCWTLSVSRWALIAAVPAAVAAALLAVASSGESAWSVCIPQSDACAAHGDRYHTKAVAKRDAIAEGAVRRHRADCVVVGREALHWADAQDMVERLSTTEVNRRHARHKALLQQYTVGRDVATKRIDAAARDDMIQRLTSESLLQTRRIMQEACSRHTPKKPARVRKQQQAVFARLYGSKRA
eukprot:TRINITY_DN20215_c0_g1_i1.p1 TRINITY_DN20215_c0_g1~~TRINITY_DN20215_c0_g1_i1.p1  ORF type:complete len:385 (+),score=39.20 TRINITY_DN20215_c0_g1_i1:44-1156(+)